MITDTLATCDTARTSWHPAKHGLTGEEHFQPFAPSGCRQALGRAYFEATVEISPRREVKRHGSCLGGFIVESIYAPTGRRVKFRLDAPMHTLVMYEEGARRDGETTIDGIASSSLRNFTKKLTFVPAGHAFHEWHEISAPLRVTYLYFDPARVKKSSNAGGMSLPRAFFEDSVVWETAAKLKNVIDTGRADNVFYSEALAGVLGHELLRSSQEVVPSSPVSRGGLAGWQIRAVTTYIDEHMSEPISLKILAEVAHLSHYHFCRAFKQSFGVPPHQYHVQRRIERAKDLLADRTASVLDVALDLGYSQPSTFSIAFRRVTGRTPREFRRSFT